MKTQGRRRAMEEPPVRTIMRLLLGPIVWAFHFSALYGFQSLACDKGVGAAGPRLLEFDAIEIFSAAVTIVALSVLALTGFVPRYGHQAIGELQTFLEFTARFLILLSIAGILLVFTTALIIPACPSLR